MEKLLSRNNLMMVAVFVILYYILKANGVIGGRNGGSTPSEATA